MATRFKAQHKNEQGIQYNIYIDDADFVGSVTDFTLSGDGFELSTRGQSNDISFPILPTEVSFGMQVEDSTRTAIETFITDLVTATEKRFQIKITKGDTSETMFWFGLILPDLSILPDSYYFAFTIRATDGLGILKDVDYNNAGVKYTGSDTLIDHIFNCLGKIGTLDTFLSGSDVALQTAVNWFEDGQPNGNDDDPLKNTRFQHKTLIEIDSKGNFKYLSCYDVLVQIMTLTLSRLTWKNGAFFVEQIPVREAINFVERRYDKDGTFIDSGSVTDGNITIDQSSVAKLATTVQTWLPALKRAKVIYNARNRRNFIAGNEWTDASGSEVDGGNIVKNASITTLNVTGNLHTKFTNTNLTTTSLIYAFFKVRVKVGSKYLERTHTFNPGLSYSGGEWVDDNTYYYLAASLSDIQGTVGATTNNYQQLSFSSPVLIESGNLTFHFEHVDLRTNQGVLIDPADLDLEWEFTNANVEVLYNGTIAGQSQSTTYNSYNVGVFNNNSAVKKIETIIGDGTTPNSFGHLEIYTGSDWEDSDGWQVAATGDTENISRLLAQELIALNKKPVRKLQGSIRGTFESWHRLNDGTYSWLFLSGTYSSESNVTTGEWFAISRDKTGIFDEVPNDAPTTGGDDGGGNVIDPDVGNNPTNGGFVKVDSDKQLPSQTVGDIFGITVIDSGITAGDTIASLPISLIGSDSVINAGDTIKLVNPITNATQNFTVSSNVGANDTNLIIESTVLNGDFPAGSFIVVESVTSAANISNSNLFEENATILDESIEDIAFIESIEIESDENAGDGATAGIRFDENGVKSYKNNSTTPTIEINADGTWSFLSNPFLGTGILSGGLKMTELAFQLYKLYDTVPNVEINENGTWYLMTDPDTGNGSKEGIEISESTIKSFNSSSSTAGVEITNDGHFKLNQAAHPTPTAGILYQYNDLFYFQGDIDTKVFPLFAPSIRVHVYDNQTSWAVGIPGAFWRATGDYIGLEIYKIDWSIGSTTGLGSGSNTVEVKKQSTVLGTADATSNYSGTISPTPSTLAADDYFTFNVTNIRATVPAMGLQVQLFFRKP